MSYVHLHFGDHPGFAQSLVEACRGVPAAAAEAALEAGAYTRSSTFRLNLSALYGIGGARRGCVLHLKGVLGGV